MVLCTKLFPGRLRFYEKFCSGASKYFGGLIPEICKLVEYLIECIISTVYFVNHALCQVPVFINSLTSWLLILPLFTICVRIIIYLFYTLHVVLCHYYVILETICINKIYSLSFETCIFVLAM